MYNEKSLLTKPSAVPAMLPVQPPRPPGHARHAVCLSSWRDALRLHPQCCLHSSLQLLLQDMPSFVCHILGQVVQPVQQVLRGITAGHCACTYATTAATEEYYTPTRMKCVLLRRTPQPIRPLSDKQS